MVGHRHNLHALWFQDQSAEAVPTLPSVPAGEIAEEFPLPEVPKEKLPSMSNSRSLKDFCLMSVITKLQQRLISYIIITVCQFC